MPRHSEEIHDQFEALFRLSKLQFGNAIKSRWFYDRDECPGCGGKISVMKFKKKNALSLNTFIYRDFGVLIAYLLCGKCARFIFKESEKEPNKHTTVHDEIERNLKKGYLSKMGH